MTGPSGNDRTDGPRAMARYDAFLHLEDTTPLRPLHMDRAGEHVPPPAHGV